MDWTDDKKLTEKLISSTLNSGDTNITKHVLQRVNDRLANQSKLKKWTIQNAAPRLLLLAANSGDTSEVDNVIATYGTNTTLVTPDSLGRLCTPQMLDHTSKRLRISPNSALLTQAARHGNTDLIIHLIEHYGMDINKTDSEGRLPLLQATKFATKETVALLIEQGADLGIKNRQGQTIFEMAALQNEPVLWYLVKRYSPSPDYEARIRNAYTLFKDADASFSAAANRQRRIDHQASPEERAGINGEFNKVQKEFFWRRDHLYMLLNRLL